MVFGGIKDVMGMDKDNFSSILVEFMEEEI